MRWFAAVLLVLYSVVIARLTLDDPGLVLALTSAGFPLSQNEALANVALFMPAGFLLAIVLGRPMTAAVLCVLGSVCIEAAQYRYFPTRVPTIEDVQHNGLGGLLGALLAWPLVAALRWSPYRWSSSDAKRATVETT